MNHPCNRFSCPEWNQGQCFGGGCKQNPAPSERTITKRRMTMKPATDTKFGLCNYPEQVLKIGRDFQNKDGFRGAHYDTVKLLCDTIEHQQEQLKAKTEAGDAAKLRESVGALLAWAEGNLRLTPDLLKEGTRECSEFVAMCCKSALAEPPRNCDVGTAEEQEERLYAYCKAHRDNDAECLYCPLFGQTGGYCELVWAQMPYEEGGAE